MLVKDAPQIGSDHGVGGKVRNQNVTQRSSGRMRADRRPGVPQRLRRRSATSVFQQYGGPWARSDRTCSERPPPPRARRGHDVEAVLVRDRAAADETYRSVITEGLRHGGPPDDARTP